MEMLSSVGQSTTRTAGFLMRQMRMFGAAGITTDEDAVRAAERLEDEGAACAEIRARMRKNQIYCRQKLADTEKLKQTMSACQDTLSDRLKGSEDSAAELQQFLRDVEGDSELVQRRPRWNSAVRDLLNKAEGDVNIQGDNADSATLGRLMTEALLQGEPEHVTAAVVLYHPAAPITECVRVVHTVGDMGTLKAGQMLRKAAKKTDELGKAILDVVATGNPVLSNPHGHATSGVSIVPLFSSTRQIFGAVVSGPVAVPDEFLELLCRTAGQLFEREGKLEMAYRMIENVENFVTKQCASGEHTQRERGTTWREQHSHTHTTEWPHLSSPLPTRLFDPL